MDPLKWSEDSLCCPSTQSSCRVDHYVWRGRGGPGEVVFVGVVCSEHERDSGSSLEEGREESAIEVGHALFSKLFQRTEKSYSVNLLSKHDLVDGKCYEYVEKGGNSTAYKVVCLAVGVVLCWHDTRCHG